MHAAGWSVLLHAAQWIESSSSSRKLIAVLQIKLVKQMIDFYSPRARPGFQPPRGLHPVGHGATPGPQGLASNQA